MLTVSSPQIVFKPGNLRLRLAPFLRLGSEKGGRRRRELLHSAGWQYRASRGRGKVQGELGTVRRGLVANGIFIEALIYHFGLSIGSGFL